MTITDKINALMAEVSLPSNIFERYTNAENMANKLTTNKTLHKAMVLFFMATTDDERKAVNRDFELTIQKLPEVEQEKLKKAFRQSSNKLLPLADDLLKRIKAIESMNELEQHKKAA
jgi:predicted nucleic acid-binding protein